MAGFPDRQVSDEHAQFGVADRGVAVMAVSVAL
jgi:hypothetical protein